MIINYQYRIDLLNNFLNCFSSNDKIKFYILSFIHYLFLYFLLFYFVLFSNNFILFLIAFCALIIQVLLNLHDNGCFIMKLERKYIGKWWYGPYTIFNLLDNQMINEFSCSIIFKLLSSISFILGLTRLYNYRFNKDFIDIPYLSLDF
jgi:hypothetical protein